MAVQNLTIVCEVVKAVFARVSRDILPKLKTEREKSKYKKTHVDPRMPKK